MSAESLRGLLLDCRGQRVSIRTKSQNDISGDVDKVTLDYVVINRGSSVRVNIAISEIESVTTS